MIGSHPRKRRAMDIQTQRPQGCIHENMIDRKRGKGRGERAVSARWANQTAHVTANAGCRVRCGREPGRLLKSPSRMSGEPPELTSSQSALVQTRLAALVRDGQAERGVETCTLPNLSPHPSRSRPASAAERGAIPGRQAVAPYAERESAKVAWP